LAYGHSSGVAVIAQVFTVPYINANALARSKPLGGAYHKQAKACANIKHGFIAFQLSMFSIRSRWRNFSRLTYSTAK